MTLRLVTLAALAAVGLSSPAFPDASILGNVYQDTGERSCNSESCTLRFDKIPAAKAIVVEHVSCTVLHNGTATGADFTDVIGSTFSLESLPLLVTKQSAVSGFKSSFAGGTGPFIIFGDKTPAVRVQALDATLISVRCAISGTIRNGPDPN